CFKCGRIEHIQAACNTALHFAARNAKLFNSDRIKLDVSDESYFNQTYFVILQDNGCFHDSFIPIESIYYCVEDMSSSPNSDQISDLIVSDIGYPWIYRQDQIVTNDAIFTAVNFADMNVDGLSQHHRCHAYEGSVATDGRE
ncbi:unnamed protein product, partial [Schistosoma margrebowiei]